LRYPPKDARDLAAALAGQKDGVFAAVISRTLVDTEASREAIMAGLTWLTQTVRKEDTAVIFLAGHGTNDNDGSYFYLPHDSRRDSRSMLPGLALQAALRAIAGRVVLLLDTCHSGNVLGRDSLTRFINELTTENRIVVFAAATGDQVARESPAWQNGAFTKAIIEGLRGAADYHDDARIMMSELETYTGVRVNELTGGAQTPTLAKPNAAPDYVLSALPRESSLPNVKQLVRRRNLIVSLSVAAAVAVGLIGGLIGGGVKAAKGNVFEVSFR
jgi:uncharacterized caspase-like protein